MFRDDELDALRRLQARIDSSQFAIQDHLEEVIRGFGLSEAIVAHMRTMRLYFRVPYMLTSWAPEHRRSEIELALAEHLFAMKILDDVVDDDSGLPRTELLGTFFLLQNLGLRHLTGLSRSGTEVIEVLERQLEVVTTGQMLTKRHVARTIEEWEQHASTYGGTFLALYGRLAALCGWRRDLCSAPAAFGFAFGMLITMSDDWRDYERHGERKGNLRHLVGEAAESRESVLALARGYAQEALDAAGQGRPLDDLSVLIRLHEADLVSHIRGTGPVHIS